MLVLLLFSIFAASLNSAVLHKAELSEKGAIYKFNLFGALMWCVCLFIANNGRLHFDANTLLWGSIYGITQALFILFKTAAMNSGPVSITTLIGNCSLVVSVVACFILWNEPISLADMIGLILLLVGLFLTTYKKATRTFTKKWAVFSLLFLVLGAGVGITFKAFSKSGGTAYTSDMMIVAAFVMLISYTMICLFTGAFAHISKQHIKREKCLFIILALVSGVLSCLYNRLNIYLSGALDGVIFFPSFNGGVVVLSTVVSMIIFKEKLSVKQLLGLLLGISGICIIGIL
jgi:uncharacterized membrane protein